MSEHNTNNKFWKIGIILIIVLCLVFASGIFLACSEKQKNKSSQLTILYTNDVHCSYENYPTIAAYKETIKGNGINTILVDGGDFVQGNPAVSGMTFTIDASLPWTENSNNRIIGIA